MTDNLPTNRAERRRMHGDLKRFLRRATRARDTEAHRRGVPTPAESIRAAVRRAGIARYDEHAPATFYTLFEPKPRPMQWKKWSPTGGLVAGE